jgi:transposase
VFLLDARTRARYQHGMRLDLACLPNDSALLQRVVRDLADVLERRDAELAETKARLADRDSEIEKLQLFLSALKRQRFGRSSEKCHPDQLALSLEAIEEQIAALQAKPGPAPATAPAADSGKKSGRRPLPGHLPREERRHEPAGCSCPSCGGKLHVIGEDVSEVLDYQPARFKVIRHVRPRFACRACESVHQAPMPSLPIERGRPGPGLLAHVLVAKYADHTPLYRQSAIYAREGVELGPGLHRRVLHLRRPPTIRSQSTGTRPSWRRGLAPGNRKRRQCCAPNSFCKLEIPRRSPDDVGVRAVSVW